MITDWAPVHWGMVSAEGGEVHGGILTDEAVHGLRVAGVVGDGEVAVTNGHLTLAEWQGEVAQLVQQTAHGLWQTHTHTLYQPFSAVLPNQCVN